MKKAVLFLLMLAPIATAYANPIIIPDPVEIISQMAVIGASFLLEICVICSILFFFGVSVRPIFLILVIGNIVSFICVMLPLVDVIKSILLLELIIVTVETVFLRLVLMLDIVQNYDFIRVKWYFVFLMVTIGNGCSYYIGKLMLA